RAWQDCPLEQPDTRSARNAGPTEVALRLAGLLLVCGEPRVEVDLPDAGAFARGQFAAVQLRAVVPGVRVGDDVPVVAGGREQPPRPGVDPQSLGPAQLDAVADRRADGELGHRRCDVVGGDELDQPSRQPDAVALDTSLDDLA